MPGSSSFPPVSTPSEAPAAKASYEVFIARQPIFDLKGALFGYELLYRQSGGDLTAGNGAHATMAAEVLVHTFLNIGVERVTGDSRAFINFTRDMLLQGIYGVLNPAQVVIELLETVTPDEEVVEAVETMVENGYTVALDDFVYSSNFEPLLTLVKIVKIDVLDRDEESLRAVVDQLAAHNVILLAERVESPPVHAMCKGMGFGLFQGYFYQRPEVLSERDLDAGHLTILRLMNALKDVSSTDAQLEDAFRGDVALTVKLLKAVNSAALGGRGIESIRHAIRLIGRGELHKWLTLILVTSGADRSGVAKELVRAALVRARFAEQLGVHSADRRAADALFMTGLLSLLDAILETPMAALLARIELTDEIKRALVARSGPYAAVLSLVESYEKGAWATVTSEASALAISAERINDMYLASLAWANDRLAAAN